MHKKLGFGARTAFLFAVVLSFGAAGCSLSGLSPAGSASVLNLSVSAPVLTSSSGRAVFSDSLVMYIRTVGGPSGGSGPMYGPYTLSGSKFTTTDLPAGAYDNMGIVCFESAPAPATIQMLASATDAEVVANDKSGTSLSGFDALCDGYAVAGLTGPLSLHSGDNSVAVSLTPLTASSTSRITLTGSTSLSCSIPTITIPASGLFRRFYCIDLSHRDPLWSLMRLSVTSSSSAPELALFDSSGKQLSSFTGSSTYYKIPKFFAQDCVYLYVRSTIGFSISLLEAADAYTLTPTMTAGGPLVTDFGALNSWSIMSVTKNYTLTNSDSVTHTVSAIKISNAAHWSLSSLPSFPQSIPAGSSITFDVVCNYNGGPVSTAKSTLEIDSDDEAYPVKTYDLTAELGS